MEALGAAASIVGIISLGVQIAQILQKQIDDVQDADNRLLQIVNEIGATNTSLQNLHELLHRDDNNPTEHLFSQQGRNDIMIILRRCNAVFRNITVLLAKAGKSVLAIVDDFQQKAGKMKSIEVEEPILDIELSSLEHLMWPWRFPKIEKYIADLDRLKLSLLLILSVAALAKKIISPYDSDASTLYDDKEDARLVAEVYYRDRECQEAERQYTDTSTGILADNHDSITQSTYRAAQILVQNWPQLSDNGGYPSITDLQQLGIVLQAFSMKLLRLGDPEDNWIEMPMSIGIIQSHILHGVSKGKSSETLWSAFARLPIYQQSAVLRLLNTIPSPLPLNEFPDKRTLLDLDITKHRRERLVERLKSLTPFYGHVSPRPGLILVVAWIRKPLGPDSDPIFVLRPTPSADHVIRAPTLRPAGDRQGRPLSRDRMRAREYTYDIEDQQRRRRSRRASRDVNSTEPVARASYYDRESTTKRVDDRYGRELTTQTVEGRKCSRSRSRSRSHDHDHIKADDLAHSTDQNGPKQIGFYEAATEEPEPVEPINTQEIQERQSRRVPSWERVLPNETNDHSQHHYFEKEPELERRESDWNERAAGIPRSGLFGRDPYDYDPRYYHAYDRGESRYRPQVAINNDPPSIPYPEDHRLRYASSMPRTQTFPYYQDEQNYAAYYSPRSWQVAPIPSAGNRGRGAAQPWKPRMDTWRNNGLQPGVFPQPRRTDTTSAPRTYGSGYNCPSTQPWREAPRRTTTSDPRNYPGEAYIHDDDDDYLPRRAPTYHGLPRARVMTRANKFAGAYDDDLPPSEEEKMSVAQYYIHKWTTTLSRMRQRLSSRQRRSHHGELERPVPFPMRPRPEERRPSSTE